jgi:hypothetical protein
MELSSKFFHINAGLKNQFLFKLSIVKNLDMFNVMLELFKLNVQDEVTMNIVIEHCQNNPNRKSLLKKVDNKLIDSIILTYREIENYLPILEQQLNLLIQNNTPNNKLFNFPICNKFKVIFNLTQVRRLYNDLNGFYQNYMMMEALFNLTLNKTNSKPNVESVSNQVNNLKDQNQQQIQPIKIQKNQNSENTDLDDLLNLCINHSTRSFIINLCKTYYIYISKNFSYIKKDENNNIQINICTIFPSIYFSNSNYLKSLLMSLFSYPIDNINMRINKIVNSFSNQDSPMIIMCKSCLLYLYYLVYLNQSHSGLLMNMLFALFNDVQIQQRILNNHNKIYLNNDSVNFNIKELTIEEMVIVDNEINVTNFGEKYHHLISVSEDSFVEKVLEDLKNISKEKIEFNSVRLININNLKNTKIAASKKNQNIKDNILLDPNELIEYDLQYQNLFEYDFNNKFLTLAHTYFNNFVQDQSNFLLSYKQNKLQLNLVPVNVINFFGIIKSLLYSNESKVLKSNSTYVYYNELIKQINDPKVFSHYTFLFILYQIIIPFMYINYNIEEFEDVF